MLNNEIKKYNKMIRQKKYRLAKLLKRLGKTNG